MFYVSKLELRNLADRVLRFYKINKGIHSNDYTMDIEALAEMLGYHVQDIELGEEAEIMGFTAFYPARLDLEDQNGFAVPVVVDEKTIILNSSIKETCVGRYHFTLAHEVAHLILDMVYHLGYRVKYRSKPRMICNESKSQPNDYEERIADMLASYLLMPDAPLRLMFKESFKCNRVDIITSFDRSELYTKFCRIADHFGVSREALSIRLQQTGMLGKYYSYQHQCKLDILPVA